MKVYKKLTRDEGERVLSLYNTSLGFLRIAEIVKRVSENSGRIHLSGVLGAGQRGIAELLLARGFRVSGSDIKEDTSGELRALGLEFYPYQDADNVKNASLLIYTLALSEENCEYVYAREHGIPTVSRGEFAAFLASEKQNSIAVSGSHGKSTVTAMLAHIFERTPDGASVLSGAALDSVSYSRLGRSETFILEACEYKDSFLKIKPKIAIINNIELDHTDYFSGLDALKKSFVKFASNSSGFALINADDAATRSIRHKISAPVLSFGTASDADYRISNVAVGDREYIFSLSKKEKSLGEFALKIPGVFNVSNAAAAIAASVESGVDLELIRGGLSSFQGISRRLEYIGEYKARSVFYDYAHHPTEIYGGIAALRAMGCDPLTVIFKSHTYSRTRDLWDGFVRALSCADYAVIGDVYAAREKNEDGISAEMLASAIGEKAFYSTDEEIIKALDNLTRGTVVIMGAGDMSEIIRRINPKK